MDLSTLNHQFAIAGTLNFELLPGNLIAARIRNAGAEAVVALHGGHVLSYVPHGGRDLLWLSKFSYFAPGKPIRGGIPVCWPWFGAHPEDPALPAHGFARLQEWEVQRTTVLASGAAQLSLRLPERPEFSRGWPHRFTLELVVTMSDRLEVELIAGNPGPAPYSFTAALHNYFTVGEIATTTVTGLDGVAYLDTVGGADRGELQHGPIQFTAETDRIYFNTDSPCFIHDPALGRTIRVAKSGSRTTVVWNPWIAKSARMPDFGDAEYLGMLCVETANARADTIVLAPGQSHRLKTIISG